MNPVATNLYLVGFMGTGKSTVGRQVAKQMDFQFIDSDQEIERTQGKLVSAIFASKARRRFGNSNGNSWRKDIPRTVAS